jgi:hypothetical protein
MESLIKTGGLYNIALVIFHLLFWQLFNWAEDLRSLSTLNRAIMQVVNLSLVFVFTMFAYLSLIHTAELLSTTLGRALLLSISVFFFLRSILQIVFFRLLRWGSVAFLVFFLAGGVLYGIPAISAQ